MAAQSLYNLIQLNSELLTYYKNAIEIWEDIRKSNNYRSPLLLSIELSKRQSEFERNCGGKYLGQELMVTVAFGQFYSILIGFDASLSDVTKIYRAFERSTCSVETKLFVDKIVDIFSLKGFL